MTDYEKELELELEEAALAFHRSQLEILVSPETTPSNLIPFCSRTGPFWNWGQRGCSNAWMMEVANPGSRRGGRRRYADGSVAENAELENVG